MRIELKIKESLISVFNFSSDDSDTIIKNIDNIHTKLRIYSVLKNKAVLGQNYLDYSSSGLRWFLDFISFEAIVYDDSDKNKVDKLKDVFRKYLRQDEKKKLLCNFLFTKRYRVNKKSNNIHRHIMFEDVKSDEKWMKNNGVQKVLLNKCSGNNCKCANWLDDNVSSIDQYLNILIDHFYAMRNAVAHESFLVAVFPSKNTDSVIDIFPVRKKEYYIKYESYMNPEVYFNITTSCKKRYLHANYLKKKI